MGEQARQIGRPIRRRVCVRARTICEFRESLTPLACGLGSIEAEERDPNAAPIRRESPSVLSNW